MCTYPHTSDAQSSAMGSGSSPIVAHRLGIVGVLLGRSGVCPLVAVKPDKSDLDLLGVWVDLRSSFGKVRAPREMARVEVHPNRPLHDAQVRRVKGVSVWNGPLLVGEIQSERASVLVGEGQGAFRCGLTGHGADDLEALFGFGCRRAPGQARWSRCPGPCSPARFRRQTVVRRSAEGSRRSG